MKLNWLHKINGNHPKFWEDYLASFSETPKPLRFVVFNCQTTGENLKEDRILSIGAVAVIENQIKIQDSLTLFIKQDSFDKTSVKDKLLQNHKEEEFIEIEAIIQFLGFIKNAILVGHQPNFAIEMINEALARFELGNIKNEYMDINIMYQKLHHLSSKQTTTLDELCDAYKIDKSDRFTTIGDTFIMAKIFLILSKKLKISS